MDQFRKLLTPFLSRPFAFQQEIFIFQSFILGWKFFLPCFIFILLFFVFSIIMSSGFLFRSLRYCIKDFCSTFFSISRCCCHCNHSHFHCSSLLLFSSDAVVIWYNSSDALLMDDFNLITFCFSKITRMKWKSEMNAIECCTGYLISERNEQMNSFIWNFISFLSENVWTKMNAIYIPIALHGGM